VFSVIIFFSGLLFNLPCRRCSKRRMNCIGGAISHLIWIVIWVALLIHTNVMVYIKEEDKYARLSAPSPDRADRPLSLGDSGPA
jgi:hypothetical protein